MRCHHSSYLASFHLIRFVRAESLSPLRNDPVRRGCDIVQANKSFTWTTGLSDNSSFDCLYKRNEVREIPRVPIGRSHGEPGRFTALSVHMKCVLTLLLTLCSSASTVTSRTLLSPWSRRSVASGVSSRSGRSGSADRSNCTRGTSRSLRTGVSGVSRRTFRT